MALDTPAKRASAINAAVGFLSIALPIPDGTIDQADRQHLLGCYSGILAASPTVPKEIWVTFSYSGGVHPSGVPDEAVLLTAWDAWATILGATVKVTRFIPRAMLDHTSVTLTQQYNDHRAHASTRLNLMMIDPGGDPADPENYVTIDGLMLELTPAAGISDLYDDPLAEHITFNAHWLQAELAYKDELAARNLTPDIIHYRTVYQPLINTGTSYPAAKVTRHDDIISGLPGPDVFYPLTLNGTTVLGPRNYINDRDNATVASIEQLGLANVDENRRLAALGGLDPRVVPVIFLRYESGPSGYLSLLNDDHAIALLDLSVDSMDEGGFAVWTDVSLGASAEAAKIDLWLGSVLYSLQVELQAGSIERTPEFETSISRTPELQAGSIVRTLVLPTTERM